MKISEIAITFVTSSWARDQSAKRATFSKNAGALTPLGSPDGKLNCAIFTPVKLPLIQSTSWRYSVDSSKYFTKSSLISFSGIKEIIPIEATTPTVKTALYRSAIKVPTRVIRLSKVFIVFFGFPNGKKLTSIGSNVIE